MFRLLIVIPDVAPIVVIASSNVTVIDPITGSTGGGVAFQAAKLCAVKSNVLVMMAALALLAMNISAAAEVATMADLKLNN